MLSSLSQEADRPLPLRLDSDVRRRWRIALLFAVALVLVYPMDTILLGRSSPATLQLRLLWGLEMVLYMALWHRLGVRWEAWVDGVHSLVLSVFFMGLVFFTGRDQSPYLSMAPSVPLMVALVFTESLAPALLAGVGCMVGTLVIWLAQGRVLNALSWSGLVGVSSFFGIYSAMRFRAAQAAGAEVLLERTRREALQKLAMAERQRAQSEKLATVGRMAANVMHELNNPLAFVRSNLEFLRTELGTPGAQVLPGEMREEMVTVLGETSTGVERMRQIVSDLRIFSRMDGEDTGDCVLADVVKEASMLAQVKLKNVARLEVELSRLPDVRASSRRMTQVLLNLLVNAADAIEDSHTPKGQVLIKGRQEGERIILDVEDNGPGFSSQALEHLFEAFFTTKGPEKGTGLGLCLSREMVERFGGTLQAENRSEGGARLRLSLPAPPPLVPTP